MMFSSGDGENPFESMFQNAQRAAELDEGAYESREMLLETLKGEYAALIVRACESDYKLAAGYDGDAAITREEAAAAVARHLMLVKLARIMYRASSDPGLDTEYLAQRREHQAALQRWMHKLGVLTHDAVHPNEPRPRRGRRRR